MQDVERVSDYLFSHGMLALLRAGLALLKTVNSNNDNLLRTNDVVEFWSCMQQTAHADECDFLKIFI